MAVRGDPIRDDAGHRLCRSKEGLGGGKVAVLTQRHVNQAASAIDRAIQIPPPTTHPNVGLVDGPASADFAFSSPTEGCYGPQAAMIAESFTPRLRYSGASLGYQLASIIAGGPSPFVATALFATIQSSLPIALYILGCAIIGIIATALLTDYTNKDISAEYERV